jgi:hypothetical protein
MVFLADFFNGKIGAASADGIARRVANKARRAFN